MSEKIDVQVKARLNENVKNDLGYKLTTYNLDEDMNYAVVVLKILITNSESTSNNEITINLTPKVQYVTPFVTKKLAEEYIKELSQKGKLMMFLPVNNGRIIAKNEDTESIINDLLNYYTQENVEYKSTSMLSNFNMIAYNWLSYSEEEKEKVLFGLGGIKNYHAFKLLFDNWEFTPEFENSIKNLK